MTQKKLIELLNGKNQLLKDKGELYEMIYVAKCNGNIEHMKTINKLINDIDETIEVSDRLIKILTEVIVCTK